MGETPALRGEYQHTKRRRERLVELVEAGSGSENVHALADELDVSVSTVRRDLAHLEADGKLARTYGGAMGAGRLDRSWQVKSTEHQDRKQEIARYAATKVARGMTVLLDSGTTVAEAAAILGARPDTHLVTNGLSSLLALADSDADVTVLGGRLRRPSESIIGAATLQMLQHLTVDVGFLGAEALHPTRGLNCPEMDQALVKQLMSTNSKRTWVLVDSSKLEREAPFSYWAPVAAGCGVITDSRATDAQLAPFRDGGWIVEIAPA
ncbi:DeoR family transcriptional regulator [Mycolicibacterium mucogenicum 261Sha1.1M5]|nr:DeoR family transcriptional regulator [Mycolicibacterium mucogenicum 261Sha1.1M5]